MKKIVIDFFSFLRRPSDQKYPNQKIFFVIGMLFFTFIFNLIFGGLLAIGTQYLGNLLSVDFVHTKTWIEDKYLLSFFVIVLIAPLLEETIFRLPLRLKPLNLWIPYSVLSLIILRIFSKINLYIFFVLAFVIILLTIYLIIKRHGIYKRLIYIWEKKYWLVFYLSALLFGYLHIPNFHFRFNIQNIIFLLILPLSQIFSGIFFGYFRIKFGFIWSVLLHMLNNSVTFIIPVIVWIIFGVYDTGVQRKEYDAIDLEKICNNANIVELNSTNKYITTSLNICDFYGINNGKPELLISEKAIKYFEAKKTIKIIKDELKIDTVKLGFVTSDTFYRTYYFIKAKKTDMNNKDLSIQTTDHVYSYRIDKNYEVYSFIEISNNIDTNKNRALLVSRDIEIEKSNLKGLVLYKMWEKKKK